MGSVARSLRRARDVSNRGMNEPHGVEKSQRIGTVGPAAHASNTDLGADGSLEEEEQFFGDRLGIAERNEVS